MGKQTKRCEIGKNFISRKTAFSPYSHMVEQGNLFYFLLHFDKVG